MVLLYQSVLSGLLIGLNGETTGSDGVYPNKNKKKHLLSGKQSWFLQFDFYSQAA